MGLKRLPQTILLVEDEDSHAKLIELNLRRIGVDNEIIRFSNGKKVLEFMQEIKGIEMKSIHYKNIIMLLDINMPVMDGYQVLKHLKSDNRMSHVPVIVLTSSESPDEIQKCYNLGCNVYITKPIEYDNFIDAINKLGLFLNIIKTPDI